MSAFLLASLLLLGTFPAEDSPRTDDYQVFLLTMDQGDEVWERFGHNALLIQNHGTGEYLAWNWGLFNFEDVDFIPRFLRGTMRYTMGPTDPDPFIDAYIAANRTVYVHELYLTSDEARALDEFVRWNYQPENRAYTYHYYLDNCSTRLRDALDGVLGGILSDTFMDRTTSRTFRWHSRRLVEETGWVDQGLSFLLGKRGDRPITEWEAMFVPMELMELLEGMERTVASGETYPLLGPRITWFEADRDPAPEAPGGFSWIWAGVGLVLAGGMGGMATAGRQGPDASRGRRVRWARAGAVGTALLWGIVSCALGGLLVMAWFTDHDFIQWNLNLLYLNPLSLVAGVAALLALVLGGSPAASRTAVWTARGVAVLALVAALLQLSPWWTQGNGEIVAVALPMNLAVAWALTLILPQRPAG